MSSQDKIIANYDSKSKQSKIVALEMKKIVENNFLKVINFENDHGHIDNSHGFKVFYKNKSIV